MAALVDLGSGDGGGGDGGDEADGSAIADAVSTPRGIPPQLLDAAGVALRSASCVPQGISHLQDGGGMNDEAQMQLAAARLRVPSPTMVHRTSITDAVCVSVVDPLMPARPSGGGGIGPASASSLSHLHKLSNNGPELSGRSQSSASSEVMPSDEAVCALLAAEDHATPEEDRGESEARDAQEGCLSPERATTVDPVPADAPLLYAPPSLAAPSPCSSPPLMLAVPACVVVWYVASISIVFLNKYLLTTRSFHFPFAMTAVSNGYIALATWILTRFKRLRQPQLSLRAFASAALPIGLSTTLDIGFSNWSLSYISIAFHVVMKGTIPLFVLLFALLLRLERPSRRTPIAVALIAIGMALASADQMKLPERPLGVILGLLSSAFSGLRWALIQLLINGAGWPCAQTAQSSAASTQTHISPKEMNARHFSDMSERRAGGRISNRISRDEDPRVMLAEAVETGKEASGAHSVEGGVNKHVDSVNKHVDGVNKHVDGVNKHVDGVNKHVDGVNKHVDGAARCAEHDGVDGGVENGVDAGAQHDLSSGAVQLSPVTSTEPLHPPCSSLHRGLTQPIQEALVLTSPGNASPLPCANPPSEMPALLPVKHHLANKPTSIPSTTSTVSAAIPAAIPPPIPPAVLPSISPAIPPAIPPAISSTSSPANPPAIPPAISPATAPVLSRRLNPLGTLLYLSPVTSVGAMACALAFEAEALRAQAFTSQAAMLELAICLAVLAVFVFVMQIAEFTIVRLTSSLTLSVFGIVKEVCTVALSMLLGDRISGISLLGLVLCILGAGVYHAKKSKSRSATNPATQLSTAQSSFKDTDADPRVSGSCGQTNSSGLANSSGLTSSSGDGVSTVQNLPKRLARGMQKRPFTFNGVRAAATAIRGHSVAEMARVHAVDFSRVHGDFSRVNGESSRVDSGESSRVSGCGVPRARERPPREHSSTRLLVSREDTCLNDDAMQRESYSYV